MFSVSACGMFAPTDPSGGSNGGGGNGAGGGQQTPQTNFTVEFNTQEQRVNDRLAAINKVKRANVAITVKAQEGEYWGSGTIIDVDVKDESGNILERTNEFYILTCAHVIDAQGEITVYVPDKNARNYTDEDYDENFIFNGVIENKINTGAITLVGGDKKSDVAVLKLDVTGTNVSASDIVEAKTPVDGYVVRRGEDVFAIGNPSGKLPMTVSAGIVSYLDRETLINSVGYMRLTQIDVQINHGSSGGGLFNMYGELVGITNAGSETYDGINYAIPLVLSGEDNGFINIAKQLIGSKTADNYGYVSGRWSIGITTNQMSSTNGSSYVKITVVAPNSNAALAGLLPNDIISKVTYTVGSKTYTEDISTTSELSAVVYELQKYFSVGGSFTFTVERPTQGYIPEVKEITINLTVENIFCDTGASVE
jgi:S1-C subfamily serine protease